MQWYEPALGDGASPSPSSLGRRERGQASSWKSKTTEDTKTTENTGPYDRAFQHHLIDFGIYPDGCEYPEGSIPPEPENIEEIQRVLTRPRASLSPSRFSREDFRKFKRADAHAAKNRQVTATVIPFIEGDVGDSRCAAREIPFTNLEHLTDGSLVPGNPDLYYGARPEQLDRQVRTELSGCIIPSTQHDLPIVPNFFLAVKGPDGTFAVTQRQACYDGVLGARGMQDLLSYKESEPIYNNAYAITSIYHAGQLKMYTSHPIQPANPGACPEYVMTQVNAYALTNDYDTFRQGVAAYRNGRDWAKHQRDKAIEQANERIAGVSEFPLDEPALSFAREVTVDSRLAAASQDTPTLLALGSKVSPSSDNSDTSADELSLDLGPQAKRSKRPVGGFRRKH